mgnify:CR=1 FL=1
MASVVESLCGPRELKRAQAMADAKAEDRGLLGALLGTLEEELALKVLKKIHAAIGLLSVRILPRRASRDACGY